MSIDSLVVVGASLAGLRAIEAARREGHRGRVVLIGDETHLPYDRPPLSKALLGPAAEEPDLVFRTHQHLTEDLGVELHLGVRADELDTDGRVVMAAGHSVPYDALVIATGSAARRLDHLPSLPGMYSLRTLNDARQVRDALDSARNVVVVGAGFIGAEVASAARARGLEVVVVEAAQVPLVRAFGDEMGIEVARLHGLHGVEVRTGVHIARVDGTDRVEAVHLSDGSYLPADLIVAGIGADPATEWLASSGLGLNSGIECDATLRTSAPGVYAAGDVARWHNTTFNRSMRLETWTSAAEQGAVAGANALGSGPPREYGTVPYMWSDWYGHRIQFVGDAVADEVTVVEGPLEDGHLVAIYRLADRVVGALAVNRPRVVMKYRAMIGRGASWTDALEFAANR